MEKYAKRFLREATFQNILENFGENSKRSSITVLWNVWTIKHPPKPLKGVGNKKSSEIFGAKREIDVIAIEPVEREDFPALIIPYPTLFGLWISGRGERLFGNSPL